MTDSRVKNRPERKPLHSRKLLDGSHLIKPGHVGRWVNDEPGKIEAYEAAGYSIVQDLSGSTHSGRAQDASQTGSAARVIVNKDPNALARYAILMEIPEEFYKEDQAAKQALLDEKEMSWNPAEMKKRNPDLYGEMKRSYS